ncbi:MAG: aminomethyl-transferring glycine dehydrogenase, partial [Candidatus Pacebacteria bacterium]|nr:aminomethyl-transferring glycine dehydrogenase [Candidatus Paceibacterota bacterium]
MSQSQYDQGFVRRHIGPSESDQQAMLKTIGAASLEALVAETLPAAIRQKQPLDLGKTLSETETLERLRGYAQQNRLLTSLIGQGYYGTITPGVIQRTILENPAWYTAYTPYQPEISQGRLEALLNFQTMIADICGLDIANASLLDEGTAASEAMLMAERVAKPDSDGKPRTHFLVDSDVHPQTLAVVRTRAEPLGVTVVVASADDPSAKGLAALAKDKQFYGILLAYPGSSGEVRDIRDLIKTIHSHGGIAAVVCDLLALTLLEAPGVLGADIAVGSAQRFGVPMLFGGPHAGFMACREDYKRNMPGRLVGMSIDQRGAPALRLALQTREQHIRREKATSNICTAQVLLAVMASMYAVYHGPEGLTEIASRVHRQTAILVAGLAKLGFKIKNQHYFDTVTVETGSKTDSIMTAVRNLGINLRKISPTQIGISLDETTTADILERVWQGFGGNLKFRDLQSAATNHLPASLLRQSSLLAHQIFHQYRSETEMLRYIRKLSDRDLALDRAMIPLGSCTMKLNATTEMVPVTWPEFANLHPFCPPDQAAGYWAMIGDLGERLKTITGYDAITFQPNSGAQGEYAGLLAIRAYHRSRGDHDRVVCLIPASAHGTNPASAQLAGMEVVVVGCDSHGNVDLADLTAKTQQHSARLAAIMITYPSTHGVFEEQIVEICQLIHKHGGQVYLDGANMNAQVGLARPGDYGADVGHLNLHKTFCIPHGGGGPGVGPIGVKSHLAPFFPSVNGGGDSSGDAVGPVSAAPFGSAGILVIPLAYIMMMGGEGLARATEVAILNANYIATRLNSYYPVLYRGKNGRVAHECILDPRGFKDSCGVTVDDIAKRLIDYGFHAPTMSFPVPGTLMIEPTESESKYELDRFIDAMIAIREEIRRVETKIWSSDNSPLR